MNNLKYLFQLNIISQIQNIIRWLYVKWKNSENFSLKIIMNKSIFLFKGRMQKISEIHFSFLVCYLHSSSRTEKIPDDISNKMILIHYADHIQDLISFQDTNWNINRIISIQIVIFIFVDDISYHFRMIRSSIIVYLSFEKIFIWFISLLYSWWNFGD